MTPHEIANWISVYAATGICCAIAFSLSIATVATELYRERAWTTITSLRSLVVFVPKTWWRWQQRYLLSTPVTLAIVGSFAATLDWSR